MHLPFRSRAATYAVHTETFYARRESAEMVRAVPARQTSRRGRPGEVGRAYRTDPLAAELRGNKGQGAAMAHLIIVHRNDAEQ